MNGSPVEVRGLSDAGTVHLQGALQMYRRWATTGGMAIPADLAGLEVSLATARARTGHAGPIFDATSEPQQAEHAIAPLVLTLEDVASRLQCSVRTVKRRIAAGHIAAIKEGRFTRVRPEDLNAYLDRQGA